jgi:hypothetical protein
MLSRAWLLVSCSIVGCGGSSAMPDATIGDSPITCDQSGGAGSGTLVDGANAMHTFGPVVAVTWQPPSMKPGSITLDDGSTKITIYGVSCPDMNGNCAPPVGEYTDTGYIHQFDAPWFTNGVQPQAQDITVDVAPPADGCWGGRFDITYLGAVSGEVKGWWANPD